MGDDGRLYTYDAVTGVSRYDPAGPLVVPIASASRATAVVANGLAYVGGLNGGSIIDVASGELVAELPGTAGLTYSTTVVDGVVYWQSYSTAALSSAKL